MNPDFGQTIGTLDGVPASRASAAAIYGFDSARSGQYALLASILLRSTDADFLTRLSGLQGTGSPHGLVHIALGQAAASASADAATEETDHVRPSTV
jgi:hypothetical protein